LKKDTYDSGFTAGEEYGRKEGIAIGEERGRNEGISIGLSQAKIETAKNLLSIGLSQEQIASVTGLSVEEIEKL
jgi:predicted transposase/invertase (TIGR01784 family)